MEYIGLMMTLLLVALIGWAVNHLMIRTDPNRTFKRAGKAMLKMGNRIALLGNVASETTAATASLADTIKKNEALSSYSFDEELGYDWLIQENEETGSAECGCTITRGSERFGDESILFKYCDTHRSAWETLESLDALEKSARAVADITHAASIGVDDPILSARLSDLWAGANNARAFLKGVEQ